MHMASYWIDHYLGLQAYKRGIISHRLRLKNEHNVWLFFLRVCGSKNLVKAPLEWGLKMSWFSLDQGWSKPSVMWGVRPSRRQTCSRAMHRLVSIDLQYIFFSSLNSNRACLWRAEWHFNWCIPCVMMGWGDLHISHSRSISLLCVGNILNLLYYLLWDSQLIIVNYSYPSALYKILNY